jgi:drug/metabolite transporter (DMT)-like permease
MSTSGRLDWTRGTLYGLASAALFGLSAPLSKRLLPDVGPMLLAGLLYLGAGAAF